MRSPLIIMFAAAILAGCAAPSVSPSPTEVAAAAASTEWDQMLADVRILSADDMQGREVGTPGSEKARAYIVGRFDAMGVQAMPVGRLQPFTAAGQGGRTYNGVNIIGMIPGTRAQDKYIVVTAHYDHEGVRNGEIYNGADDNASGVATMLELARRLKASPPEHSVIFVAFDAEERGLLGAKHFVQAPPVPLTSIVLNLNMDETARLDVDGRLWAVGTHQNPSLRPILEALPARGSVSLAFGKDRPEDTGSNNWVPLSDQAPFHAAGLPFIFFSVEFHPDYHKPTDDYERITVEHFINASQLAIDSFRALDQALDR